MSKRAAIYIRTSSEQQATKVSPQAQEKDCRDLCQNKGYEVIGVYSDTEKYKAGTLLVEPSGTRADRPQYRRMISDAYSGNLDVVVAWREDRLYRGFRPMLDLSDCLDKTDIDVELVKETFDKKMMGIKASVGKMELDAKHDRFMMGVSGRLASGRAWNGQKPYGYERDDDGHYVVNENEAQWIRLIFKWYAEGKSLKELHNYLGNAGAQQRRKNKKWSWTLMALRQFLHNESYWTGKQYVDWNGQRYEIELPAIIDKGTAQRVNNRRASYKAYPAGNIKDDFMVAGLIHCGGCGVKMKCWTITNGYKRKDGTMKPYRYYGCNMYDSAMPDNNCLFRIPSQKVDDEVWEKVWKIISSPELFEGMIQNKIDKLRAEEADAQARYDELINKREELDLREQGVLTLYGEKRINRQAVNLQLEIINAERVEIEREIGEKKLLLGDHADNLVKMSREYRDSMVEIFTILNTQLETPEHHEFVKKNRRKFIQTIVKKVAVYKDKSIKVHTFFDIEGTSNEISPTR